MPIISVDLEIPQLVLDNGGIQLYAKAKGWTENITEYPLDGEGNPMQPNVIPNPVEALDFAKSWIKNNVRQDFMGIYTNAKVSAAAAQANAELAAMFTPEE